MLFNRGVPKEISAVKLKKWFRSLDDRDKNRIARYAPDADTSSQIAFLTDVMSRANAEDNHAVSLVTGEFGATLDMSDTEKFDFVNEQIEAFFGSGDIGRAKELCLEYIELIPKVIIHITADGVPEFLPCRNRLIDILVGTESNYDEAIDMLVRFNEMEVLPDEDLDFRIQSLKVHKLQRTFDSVFSLNPEE